jgi:hypothetical protein
MECLHITLICKPVKHEVSYEFKNYKYDSLFWPDRKIKTKINDIEINIKLHLNKKYNDDDDKYLWKKN